MADSALGATEALAKARKAASKLKRKDAAVYWATVAQTAVLTEIRDELRALNQHSGGVTLPDDAPAKRRTSVAVQEP
ncbi:hypothetical protein [Amycolatopsis sp. CA-230715]|uniref:hypothetical protein n=1 Tax=Amycolatopsis sp. CA-230715 TaxID=2745196 RepID=UPI001C03326D|nr:hypothetical protein [Amycolatopsis sp. CA-230715]QWF79990.1 hypothetical protein HUW46_03404 [Amycolatopsis sp. CA-230715]